MRIRPFASLALAAVAMLFAGCATTSDPGWHGKDATAYDAAVAACRNETATSPADLREDRFDACMSRHGWTRGQGRGD